MSVKRMWAAGAAVAAMAFASAGVAEAAQVRATFNGVITKGFDGGGKVFGLSDLAGQTYKVTYLIDEEIYTARSALPGAPVGADQNHYQIVGGYYDKTPILSVALTINGVTETFDYDDYENAYADGRLEWMNSPGAPFASIDVRGNLGREAAYSGGVGRDNVNFVSQIRSSTLMPYTLADGWTPQDEQYSPIPVYFARSIGDARGGYDIFYQITSGTVTSASFQAGVPEPATWAMMIMGFGGAGAVIRRRRTLAA